MGIIKDNKKFKRKIEQTNPTNPIGNTDIKTNKFDIDEDTIRDQQKKSNLLKRIDTHLNQAVSEFI